MSAQRLDHAHADDPVASRLTPAQWRELTDLLGRFLAGVMDDMEAAAADPATVADEVRMHGSK